MLKYKSVNDNKVEIGYEIRKTEYRGPKGRAIEALNSVSMESLSEKDFFSFLDTSYHDYIKNISWVRFHDYFERKTKKRRTVAIINTNPKISIREGLFRDRLIITKKTGWYPLIMGSKEIIKIRKPFDTKTLQDKLINFSFGNMLSIEKVEDGNGFKLIFNYGDLLLDTGFDCNLLLTEKVKAVFISHSHKDHSGGLKNILEYHKKIPIFLSLQTYNSLSYIYNEKKFKEQCIIVNDIEKSIKFGKDLTINFFLSYHTPGALGIKITDRNLRSLIFLGDFCFKNGFLDYSDNLKSLITSGRNTILLDSAFVKNKYENNIYTDTPDDLLNMITVDKKIPNVFFIADTPESLVYLYLYFFKKTSTGKLSKKIFIDNNVINASRAIWFEYNKNLHNNGNFVNIDPFVRKLWNSKDTNFFESVRVYKTSPLLFTEFISGLYLDETILGFLTASTFKQYSNNDKINKIFNNSYIYIIGRSTKDDEIKNIIKNKIDPQRYQKLASEDWIFHSNENDLHKYITENNRNMKNDFILFHSSFWNLKKFINENKINNANYFHKNNKIELH